MIYLSPQPAMMVFVDEGQRRAISSKSSRKPGMHNEHATEKWNTFIKVFGALHAT